MAQEAPLYDLTLLLSQNASEEQRAKVLSDVQSTISSAGGQVERDDTWGRRPTAYQIKHQAEAEYHMLQFKAPPQLIEELSHTLRITDGVLRFRVIKNRPGTPAAPSSPPPVVVAAAPPSSAAQAAAATAASGGDSAPSDADSTASEPATAAPPADAPAEAEETAAEDAIAPEAATATEDAAAEDASAAADGAGEEAAGEQAAAGEDAASAETQPAAAQDE